MGITILLVAPAMWAVAIIEFLLFSRGYSLRDFAKAVALYALCAVVATLPMAVAGHAPASGSLLLAAFTAFAGQLVYPLIHTITRGPEPRRCVYTADAALGMCVFGLLSALLLMGGAWAWIVGPFELLVLGIVVVQITYFALYGACMDAYGYRLMTQTNTNEVIEFIRYYPLWISCLLAVLLLGVLACSVYVNVEAAHFHGGCSLAKTGIAGACCILVACVGGHRSVAARSAFISFVLARRHHMRSLARYASCRGVREQGLTAAPLGAPSGKPSTILLVIGESANRDYMSAFNPSLGRDTTPWLKASAEDNPQHWMIFPHAYSCAIHTFPALEKGLTELNQFNSLDFDTAPSIVDMARAAGRRVYWFSNQGHLGASLSQVSVVAEQADVARWTDQQPGLPPYDSELLPFLDTVDPTTSNLVVLHLKGNHFSFENRYPASEETWRPDGPADAITAYENSMHYVDSILHRAWTMARERLNLEAMVYCSDHAIIPDKHRAPTFMGFGDVRIPLAVWTSPEYEAAHPERVSALRSNTGRYWTNDFLYELICGILDVESDHFKASNSLAHNTYHYTRDDLTVLNGTIPLSDDRS
ncbi:MAG: sulfatase-like hydrolase/transferase [Muribaculaceae bacterium]|nr:sulfatase-like hydrolase/transferase [Muribaculaceae bacterium]